LTTLADVVAYVIGVDTHKEQHTAAVVDARGGVVEEVEVRAAGGGYRQLLHLAEEQAEGIRAWAIEGTGSYGTGLADFLREQGEWVIESERPKRSTRRRGKSDIIDARRAARDALALEVEKVGSPRQGGDRKELSLLLVTRDQVMRARTRTMNQLYAAITEAPEELRARLRGMSGQKLLQACTQLRHRRREDPEWETYVVVIRDMARRALALGKEAKQYEQLITVKVEQTMPGLLQEVGVGPISAGLLLCSWSHPGRFRSEAAFARMSGSAPLEASSGENQRHRLDPGGDRQLNRALHMIAVNRQQRDPATIEYTQRRRQEGKTPRETKRCLKRYLARKLFRLMERASTARESGEQMYVHKGSVAA
jgi:transposase